MEEVIKRIKEIEKFANKKEQFDVLKEINDEEILNQQKQDEDKKFDDEKNALIKAIDAEINRIDFEKTTNNPQEAINHLLALRGVLLLTNINNVAENSVEMEKKRYLLYGDIKNKTLEQQLEMKRCQENLKKMLNPKQEEDLDIEKESKNNFEQETKKTNELNKKANIFVKIKQFFMSRFGRNKRLNEINKNQKAEELKLTRKSVAPIEKQEDDIEIDLDFSNIKNRLKVNEETKMKEEPDLRESAKIKDGIDRRVKYGDKYLGWKNGNVTVIDEDENSK